MRSTEALYSLGFNFDRSLIDGLISANERYGGRARIDEVFGALPDSPIPSARPTTRIPRIEWGEFRWQVQTLQSASIEFNFLMNTAHRIDATLRKSTIDYLNRLVGVGVSRLTVGTPELCRLVKNDFPRLHVTMSITYGIDSQTKLSKAEAAGADAVYLDGVSVNRNFELLRSLSKNSRAECRLYANMSCISHCPVVRQHYSIFAGTQKHSTAVQNDAFFAGCTLIKMKNPVEWLQMPWIRPEDIRTYVAEGVHHFKLADRLAPTETLLTIARSYLRGISPKDIFVLMERDGSKYRMFLKEGSKSATGAISVLNRTLPDDFIDHFRLGGCKSNDVRCKVCCSLAGKAVRVNRLDHTLVSTELAPLIPSKLKTRAARKLSENQKN